jgi:hypothetical protein
MIKQLVLVLEILFGVQLLNVAIARRGLSILVMPALFVMLQLTPRQLALRLLDNVSASPKI